MEGQFLDTSSNVWFRELLDARPWEYLRVVMLGPNERGPRGHTV